jgi:hypothetical protein
VDRADESSFPYASGDGTGDFRSGDIDAGDGDVAGAGRFCCYAYSPPAIRLGVTLVVRIADGAWGRPSDATFVIRPRGTIFRGPAL